MTEQEHTNFFPVVDFNKLIAPMRESASKMGTANHFVYVHKLAEIKDEFDQTMQGKGDAGPRTPEYQFAFHQAAGKFVKDMLEVLDTYASELTTLIQKLEDTVREKQALREKQPQHRKGNVGVSNPEHAPQVWSSDLHNERVKLGKEIDNILQESALIVKFLNEQYYQFPTNLSDDLRTRLVELADKAMEHRELKGENTWLLQELAIIAPETMTGQKVKLMIENTVDTAGAASFKNTGRTLEASDAIANNNPEILTPELYVSIISHFNRKRENLSDNDRMSRSKMQALEVATNRIAVAFAHNHDVAKTHELANRLQNNPYLEAPQKTSLFGQTFVKLQ